MRRASAQAWLASARSQPPPLSQISTRIGAQSAATILTGAAGSSIRSASLLSTVATATRPNLHTPFTTTAASATLRRLGLNGLAQPLRAGLRSKLSGGRRSYSTEVPAAAESAKVAETPASLDALRAEFYEFQKRTLNWNIGGVQVPKAVLWLVFFQFLGLAPYSFALERNESVVFVREYMEKVQSMAESSVLPLGDDHNQHMPSFTRGLTGWERTALHSVASVATLSVIAFLWARRRTRRSFNSFILSRALGEPTGTYPITMENVVRKGDALKIKGEGLKSVRSDVVRLAGLKAVQASVGLLLASTASSYAFTTWVGGKVRDGVIRFRRSDVLQGEAALSLVLLFNFLVSWAVLVYQPYTIFPFVISNMLVPRLPFADRKCKLITSPKKEKPVVTEHKAVVEVDGGKEFITVTEKKSGSSYSRTEKRVFVPDDADAHARQFLGRKRREDSTTNANTADA
ncbi:uncharacterized protein ACA1_119600 [Acanthamoeba castellanii str. Neff]|uniref:Transmembrane protein n=1 Tax=Acanthamoeba castellanii (strain ATCC 30010 / Neff) TaxID=1257118 RepID=L8H1S8_ACACF|nr:uncharacterized protein ACA1_119600 [Acanthamoeba castellanii str. Neff]ELR18341.1 hypothetical protein ACA1_119600 [Acanthamoeba castellanii str. Neff]